MSSRNSQDKTARFDKGELYEILLYAGDTAGRSPKFSAGCGAALTPLAANSRLARERPTTAQDEAR